MNNDDSNNNNNIEYNDFHGYFDTLESEIPLTIKNNVKLFKSLSQMIDEYFAISTQQELEQIKKNELIIEMAATLEMIYLNANQPHLVETIGSTLCLILNKKDKITSPSYIYQILEKKYKNRYSTDFGRSKRTDIFSKRKVRFNEFRENMQGVISFLDELPKLDLEMHSEFLSIQNKFDEARLKAINQINNMKFRDENLPEEDDSNNNNDGEQEEDDGDDDYNTPSSFESKYYKRLGQYIELLQKLKENVLKYPPSPRLDEKLDQALGIEIEILKPSIDMKYKRSIPQLDETVLYADNQSLNGASSVMSEPSLVKDFRGHIPDPRDRWNKFLEITHKLTPEQIDTRKPYISIIRKIIKKYQPHIYYHLKWYEGADEYKHKLSMGKFARSNLLKRKMN